MHNFILKGFYLENLIIKKRFNQNLFQKRLLSNKSVNNSVKLSFFKFTSNNQKISHERDNPMDNTMDNTMDNPVLIFHGLFGSKNNWKSISKVIASKTGRTVYAFDLRNHGLSPHTQQITLQQMSDDIKTFLDENHYKRAALIGHSLGGRAVMQFAFICSERVEKLIGVDITPSSSVPSAFFLKPSFIDRLSESIKDIPKELGLAESRKLVNEKLKTLITDNFIRGFFLMSLDKDDNKTLIWRYNLEAIKSMIANKEINKIRIEKPFFGESLIICGQNSEYVRSDDYSAIREVLPNVNIVSIPETGHYLHIEKPNEFLDYVIPFLNSKKVNIS